MKVAFSLRLFLDLVAVSLLLIALAYDWLGNMAHEVIGTVMFLLLVSHNIFNRRWYGTVVQKTRVPRTILTRSINLSLLATMMALLVTSVLISQNVFAFLPLSSTFTARQIHMSVGYLALIVAAIHLGLHWKVLTGFLCSKLGIGQVSRLTATIVRGLATIMAGYGVYSLFALNVGAKLLMQPTMEFWDFQERPAGFFGHLLAIICLFASLAKWALTTAKSR